MNGQYYYSQSPQNPMPPKPNQTLSIISLITGIISVLFVCCCGFAGIIFSLAAIICAIVQKSKDKKMSGMSIAGLILGIVGILGFILWIVGSILISMNGTSSFDQWYSQYYNGEIPFENFNFGNLISKK